MAAVVAWVGKAVSALWATAASKIIWTAVKLAVAYGVSAYTASAQKSKMQKALGAAGQSGIDQGRSVMSRDPVAPRQIVYGQVLKSGSISFMEVGGSSNEYLYMNIDIADHLCEELGTVYFDKQPLTLDGSGNITSPAKYVGYGRVLKFLGLVGGERDTVLEGELPSSWTANHLGKEVARLHIKLKHNPEAFTNGIPLVEVMVKGRKLYDFRTATTVWSANSALCVSDFLMDSRFGKGVAQARIISADVIEAANICDENVTLNPSGTEDRYTTNGVVNGGQDPDSVLAELESAMAGTVSDPGGKWSIRAGAYRTPTITFTDDDFASTAPFSMTPRQSRQDTFNGVRGQFIGPINEWGPADFPAITNAAYMVWDGGIRLWKDVVYNFTTSAATAQRLAKTDLERGRQQIVVQADFKLKAIQCQPGDVVMMTRANLGWSSKPFEVLEWALKITESGGGPVIVVAMILKETASTAWDWANGEETLVDAAPNTNLWDASYVATPSTPTLSTSNFVQSDGTISPRLRVQWTAATDEFVAQGGYTQIEYKQTADSTWLVWSSKLRGTASEDFITDVRTGISYDVRIRFENVRGVRGSYSATATTTVSADVSAPATPTGLLALAGPGSVILDWIDNTETDLALYELFRNTSNSFPGGTPFWSGRASQYADFGVDIGGLVVATTYYYWLKAVDSTNNKSSQTSSVNAAPNSTTGATGPAGLNNATVFLYQRASSAPSLPGSTLTYTFSTGGLSGTLGSWSQSVPADNGNALYITAATASSTATTDSIASGEWSAAVVHTQSGLQAASLFLYQRASSTPSLPGSTLTYTFSTGALSGTLGSWSQSVPAVNGDPCYVTQSTALASATATTDSIASGEWSAAVKLVQDGATGATGSTGSTGATGADGADGATVLGVASGASTVNGTSPVSVSALLLASLSIPAGTRIITYNGVLSNASGSTNVVRCAIYAAGSAIKTSEEYTLTAGQGVAVTLFVTETPGAGTRTYQMYGWSSTGSAYDLVVGGELIVQ